MKHRADEMYTEANYVFMAHSAALANLFRKKGQKSIDFKDVVERPSLAEKEKPLTEDEIKLQRERFVTMFMVKKDNYELANPDKVWR